MIRSFLITFIVFMLIDLVWLGIVAKKLYATYLGFIMTDQINWTAAVIFYVIYVIGIIYFAINGSDHWQVAMLRGAIFGFIAYATYDLTNLATLKNWPLTLTLIDLTWGTFLTSATATISYLILNR